MFTHLFQRRLSLAKLIPDRTDRHSHILHGVDDGSPNLQESHRIIDQLRLLGFTGAWCTPHIHAGTPKNTPDRLRKRFAELTASIPQGFELHLAAEYMLDDQFGKLLESEELLSHDNKHLLVEFPQYSLPGTWKDLLSQVIDRGYTPVLAHPERYCRILSVEEIKGIPSLGVVFQGNLGSISGIYGKRIRDLADQFRRQGLYQWWGTDVHNASMLNKLIIKA